MLIVGIYSAFLNIVRYFSVVLMALKIFILVGLATRKDSDRPITNFGLEMIKFSI